MALYSVYVLTNIVDGMCYVGSVVNKNRHYKSGSYNSVSNRRSQHLTGGATNKHVRAAVSKYGRDNFDFKVIYKGLLKRDAKRIEKQTIKRLNCVYPLGYNITHDGQYPSGDNHPMKRPENRANMSNAQKSRPKSSEHRTNISAALKGRKHHKIAGDNNPSKRPEVRAKQSEANRLPDEKRNHIRYLYKNSIRPLRVIASIVQVSRSTVKKYTQDLRRK